MRWFFFAPLTHWPGALPLGPAGGSAPRPPLQARALRARHASVLLTLNLKIGTDVASWVTHTYTPVLTALCPGLPGWAGIRKVKPIWILLKQESEWQWHQLGHMQVCALLQTDNHASTPPLSFLQARFPSCRPTNSVKALNARASWVAFMNIHYCHIM